MLSGVQRLMVVLRIKITADKITCTGKVGKKLTVSAAAPPSDFIP